STQQLVYKDQLGRRICAVAASVHLDQHGFIKRNTGDATSRIEDRVKPVRELFRDPQVQQVVSVDGPSYLRSTASNNRFGTVNLASYPLGHLVPSSRRNDDSESCGPGGFEDLDTSWSHLLVGVKQSAVKVNGERFVLHWLFQPLAYPSSASARP